MSTFIEKPVSLLEKKKQQWAKERDELANLSVPWGRDERPKLNRLRIKNLSADPSAPKSPRRDRRSSLPPLSRPQNYTASTEKLDMGGETSGYGSDNPNFTPDFYHHHHQQQQQQQQTWSSHQTGYESSASCRDDRLKWGDRGVVAGKFWNEYGEKVDAPGWVKRGLQRENTELVGSNSSPAESPEQCYTEERPFTSSTVSQNKSYIRGQNSFIDPLDLAERERRRQLALAHQEAIKQQLEEKERKRREERERRIREEREEELRIEREQEIERQRRELELKRMEEKRLKDMKRKEALQEALDLAEKEAKAKKEKSKRVVEVQIEKKEEKEIEKNKETDSTLCVNVDERINDQAAQIEVLDNQQSNYNHIPQSSSQFPDNMALVLQTPLETLQSMQFAVLMPNLTMSTPQAVPIAVPVAVSSPRTENRVLTPTLYRNKNVRDSSTQTDFQEAKNSVAECREKIACLDLNCEGRTRKGRSRNEERVVEIRPKWGANRPPTRYLKQSEKDPFYQRRKLRQKMRQMKVYDDKNNNDYSPHSSDDSQEGYQRKGLFVEKRRRATWRKHAEVHSRELNLYQTEIVPIESDRNQIYYKPIYSCRCCCQCVCGDKQKVKTVEVYRETKEGSEKSFSECGTYTEQNSDILDSLGNLHSNLLSKQEELMLPKKHS